jgi:hypothetical protein
MKSESLTSQILTAAWIFTSRLAAGGLIGLVWRENPILGGILLALVLFFVWVR